MKYWLILLAAIFFEVLATSSMKSSDGFTRLLPSVISVLGYCLSLYLLSICLRHIPVGIAYAVWAGVGIVLITLSAWFFFHQKLDVPALLGITMIISGVVIMNVFSNVDIK